MSDDFDFHSETDRLLLALKFLSGLDLDALSEAMTTADTLGPFVDPTAYRDMLYRRGNMHDVARLVELARPLVAAFEALQEKVGAPA